jgi:hypothetical protein
LQTLSIYQSLLKRQYLPLKFCGAFSVGANNPSIAINGSAKVQINEAS